jgi:hypothetical protein
VLLEALWRRYGKPVHLLASGAWTPLLPQAALEAALNERQRAGARSTCADPGRPR